MQSSGGPIRLHRFENGQISLAEGAAAMHSRVGPVVEAREVYAAQALIAPERRTVLWDVGMGTASNVLLTLNSLEAPNDAPNPTTSTKLEIHSFESRPDGLELALQNLDAFEFLTPWVTRLTTLLRDGRVVFHHGAYTVDWRLWVGEFTQTAPLAAKHGLAQRVFYDFYAPSESADFWTLAAFARLKTYCDPDDCRVITYVAATAVRSAMILAGFELGEGAGHASKWETTIAQLSSQDPTQHPGVLAKPLNAEWLDRIARSTKPLPPDAPPNALEILQKVLRR